MHFLTYPGGLAAGLPVTMETRVTKMAADKTRPLSIFERRYYISVSLLHDICMSNRICQ